MPDQSQVANAMIHGAESVTIMISIAPGITMGVTLMDADIENLYLDRKQRRTETKKDKLITLHK